MPVGGSLSLWAQRFRSAVTPLNCSDPRLTGHRCQWASVLTGCRWLAPVPFVRVHAPLGLKLKPKLTLTVTVTGGSSERITWGGGEAVMLAFRCTHPRTGTDVEIRQAVRVPRGEPLAVQIGQRAELICWGVMSSGMLRHPVLG